MGTPSSDYRYWAFISYSSKDKSWGRWLHRAIESYGIPSQLVNHPTPVGHPAPRRFQPIFRDREELPASANLGAQIEEALRASRYLIVVCSMHSAQSKWVNKEIETFQRLDRHGRIFAIIVDGEPNAHDERECFPPALLSEREPLAADARPQGDGKTNAKLKLLAGMLGVNYDALKQRDVHRRNRRLQIVLASSLLLTLSFAALSWYANQQRAIAVERNVQLRRILSGLLWSLSDHIDAIPGSLKIKDEILEGVEHYFSELTNNEKHDIGLQRELAITYHKSGEVRMEQGRLKNALALFLRGVAINQQLVKSDVNNAIYHLDLASNHGAIGEVYLFQGKLKDAEAELTQGLNILTSLKKKIPDYEPLTRELCKIHLSMGLLNSDSGNVETAKSEFNESLKQYESLVKANPQNVSYIGELAETSYMFSSFLLTHGYIDAAQKYALYCITLAGRVVKGKPDHRPNRIALAIGNLKLAEALLAKGNIPTSVQYSEKGMTELSKLREADPESSKFQMDVLYGLIAQARIYKATSKPKLAFETYLEALQCTERLLQIDDSNAAVRKMKILICGELALMEIKGLIVSSQSFSSTFLKMLQSMQTEGMVLNSQLENLKKAITKWSN